MYMLCPPPAPAQSPLVLTSCISVVHLPQLGTNINMLLLTKAYGLH